MSNVRKPRMPRPRIPKIKKPSISNAKRLRKKLPTLSVKRVGVKTKATVAAKPANKKKHTTTRRHVGTCYFQSGCRYILAKDVSKTQCKKMGGKSWKIQGGKCELIE